VRVKNPTTYNVDQQRTWRLWTQTKDLDYVDGSLTSLLFQLPSSTDLGVASESSWGIYRASLTKANVAFNVEPLLPYSLSLQEATITVFPLRTTVDVNTTLRITAPFGYMWYFASKDFVYERHTQSRGRGVVGATADLPGKVPQRRGNVLEWGSAGYEKRHTYGFITSIRVPDHTPTQSANAFFVEFGYTDRTWGANYRSLAGRVLAAPVRAMRNAKVEYTSRIKGATNALRFTIEIATPISLQGGLLIVGPAGFVFSDSCNPAPVAGSTYKPLPDDTGCQFQKTNTGEVKLSITAGETGIPVGLYAFEITGRNPSAPAANRDGENTLCGTALCWTFYSLEIAKDGLISTELDKRISASGFSITDQMLSAMILPIAEVARATSGRDDRPLHQNWLTFTFQLGHDVTEKSMLTVRGPAGFVFTEDCFAAGGVRTKLQDILGSSTSPVEMHTAWEPSVPVFACEGKGPVAKLEVGAGLRRQKSYIFSIRVSANPERTPEYNKWVIEFPQESSAPFDGFIVWTFTETSIRALSTSAVTLPKLQNFVNVTFRVHNDLDSVTAYGGGVLMLIAPAGYKFAPATECDIILEERDPLWPQAAPVVFPKADLACIPGLNPNTIAIELKSAGRHVLAKRRYTWTVRIYNPSAVTAAGAEPPIWELRSFQDRLFKSVLDEVKIPGFVTNRAVSKWKYTGSGVENGGMRMDSLLLTLLFPDDIEINDQIVITAPIGYDLGAPTNQEGQTDCNNLRWGPGDPSPVTVYSRATCRKNRLIALILEDSPIRNNTTITVQIGTSNPKLQPPIALDYWHAHHLSSSGRIESSGTFQGWKIVPQLQQMQVLITGHNIAAGSLSELDFKFVAVSAAVSLTIAAVLPVGLDFGFARLPFPDQIVIDSVQSFIRAKVPISAGVTTHVRIVNVKLAVVGGLTKFDMRTYSEIDSVVDQKVGFTGFRLPGSIKVSDVAMTNKYKLAASMHPVRSRWPPQFGKTLSVFFTLTFSNSLVVGHLLQIQCPSYAIRREPFSITDTISNALMPTEVSFVSGAELHALLLVPLRSERAYRLNVQATAPVTRSTKDEWLIQVTDGSTLPVAHSFVELSGFPIIGELGLKVDAAKTPPAAYVEVSLLIVLGDARPTLITVIAPPTFMFKPNCLVAGGSGILGCSPGPMIAGRPTAQLSCSAADLTNIVQGIKVFVGTPSEMPASRNWFVEASMVKTGTLIGWGEDSAGITITPMKDVGVVYAGVPNIMSQLALRFRTSETLNRGGKLNIVTPPGFVISCVGTALKAISLPGLLECKVKAPSVFLTLNDTLTPGEYAFAITVRTPVATPTPNTFSLLLVDERGRVQDSAMNLPGQDIRTDLGVVGTPLKWTSSEAGQASTITIGFTVKETVSVGLLGAILITFPENFGHAIEKASSVVSKRDQLPLKKGDSDSDWLDFRMVDRLIIILDPAKRVEKGNYQLEFPVTVPEQMPAYNVWQVTLCQHSANGVCLQAQGPQSLLTFPFAGFYLGEVMPGMEAAADKDRSAASSPAQHRGTAALWQSGCLVALVALNLGMRGGL